MKRSWVSHSAGLALLLALLPGPAWSEAQQNRLRDTAAPLDHGLNAPAAVVAAAMPEAAAADSLQLKLAQELARLPAPAGAAARPSPTLFAMLSAILLFLAANIVLLLLFSVVMRLWRERGQRRRDRFYARWEPVLHARMSGDAVPLPRLPPAEHLLFLGLWLHLLGYVRDQAADALVQTARELGLPRHVLHLLQSGSSWKRVVAMRAAAALRLAPACDALLAKVLENRPRSSLTALRALLQIDPERGFAGLAHLLDRQNWSPGAMVEIVRAGGSQTVRKLSALLRSSAPGQAKQLVRLIELLEDQTALPALRARLASSRDAQEIAATLHCLGRLGDGADRIAALAFLEHQSWLVRMQAAFALGSFGLAQDIARLAPLLRDAHWWVRYRSAQSLLRLAGAAAVAAMREGESDPYACEMLERVLAEGR